MKPQSIRLGNFSYKYQSINQYPRHVPFGVPQTWKQKTLNIHIFTPLISFNSHAASHTANPMLHTQKDLADQSKPIHLFIHLVKSFIYNMGHSIQRQKPTGKSRPKSSIQSEQDTTAHTPRQHYLPAVAKGPSNSQRSATQSTTYTI